ncbi:hypothetical protein Dimus_025175 [Dionaea muscipula]
MAEAEAPNPIRFGILGCADIARKVSRAIILAPNAALHAIGSRSIDKARRYAEANGFPPSTKIYGSYEEVLDDPDVDAVYTPLPTSLHLRWAVLAAQKKKHLLLEKPVALNVAELDLILEACESNGVQFMDGTMWMHHPRTPLMKDFLSDPHSFGKLRIMQSFFSVKNDLEFLKNDIRVKPDLDGLGALGDLGWYCIRAILWAADYQLPNTVTALHGAVTNDAGVLLACGANLVWEKDAITATFHCSFLCNLTMDFTAVGTEGTLKLHDFVVPFEESVASFSTAFQSRFFERIQGVSPLPTKHRVMVDLPQEVCMVKEFSALVGSIQHYGSKPEKLWVSISRKTQLVLDAVKASFEKGFQPVALF